MSHANDVYSVLSLLVSDAVSSSDRQCAERALFEWRSANADVYADALRLVMINGAAAESVRHIAIIMLRQTMSNSAVWSAVSPTTRLSSYESAAATFCTERAVIARALTHLLAVAAARASSTSDWVRTRLIPLVLSGAADADRTVRRRALALIEELAEFAPAEVKAEIARILNVVVGALTDTADAQCRQVALRAVVAIAVALTEDELTALNLARIVPHMFHALSDAADAGDDENIVAAVDALDTLVTLNCTFLRAHLPPIVALIADLCVRASLEPSTRRSALELLITLSECGRGMIRRQRDFAKSVIPITMHFAADVDGAALAESDWANQAENECDDDDEAIFEQSRMGQTAIERLAAKDALGGRTVYAIAAPLLAESVASADWRRRFGGLMLLTHICDGCADEMKSDVERWTERVVALIADDSPAVRWSALMCAAAFANTFSPVFESEYNGAVIPAMIACMQPSQPIRIICQSALCAVDVCGGSDKQSLSPYLTALLSATVPLLHRNDVAEFALGIVSASAVVCEDAFAPFFAHFIGGVRQLIDAPAQSHAARRLRAKAVECAGCMANAVGAEVLTAETASALVNRLVLLQSADDDEETSNAVTVALFRLAKCLGAAFAPYLPMTLPAIIQAASISDAMAILDEDDTSGLAHREGFETSSYQFRGGETKRVAVNAHLFQRKSVCSNIVYQMTELLRGNIRPFIQPIADAVIANIDYPFSTDVRLAAASTVAPIVVALVEGTNSSHQPSNDELRFTWSRLLPAIIAMMRSEFHLDNLTVILEAFADSLRALSSAGFRLSDDDASASTSALVTLTTESVERMSSREQRRLAVDFDVVEAEAVAEENESDEEFLGYIYDAIASLMSNGHVQYLTHFDRHVFPLCSRLLSAPSMPLQVVIFALVTVSQCIDDMPPRRPETLRYCALVWPTATAMIDHEHRDARQSAAFAVGAIARCSQSDFAPHTQSTLNALTAMIVHPDSNTALYQSATDCAVGAVGKICCEPNIAAVTPMNVLCDAMKVWLSALPLSGDVEEAQKVHSLLIDLVATNSPFVTSSLERVVNVFAAVLDTECITESDADRIAELINVWAKQGKTHFANAVQQMNENDKSSIQRRITVE